VGIAVIIVLAIGSGVFLILRGGSGGDSGSAVTNTAVPTSVAPTVPPTAAPTVAPTSAAPTTVAVTIPPGALDLGSGVSYTVPNGFTASPVQNGYEITDGTLRFFAQVGVRTAGEDPLVVMQQYIDSFDAQWGSANFSQTVVSPVDSAGPSPVDGYTVYYRVLDADGSGLKGVLDASRRGDGLVYLTDIYVPVADTTSTGLPAGVIDQFYASFVNAPSAGPSIALTPLTVTRVSSVHAPSVIDGVVALAPPAGWNIDLPGPGRVAFSKPTGEQFRAVRLADSTDPLVAQDLAFAELQAMLPGAAVDGFASPQPGQTAEPPIASFISALSGSDAAGRAVDGRIEVWCDRSTGAVFSAITFGVSGDPVRLPAEELYLFTSFRTMVELPR
jgi:hypothetical protein